MKREWRAQIRSVRDAGLALSHLDSHRHVHAWPPLCDLVIELAIEAKVPYVRAPRPGLSVSALARRAAHVLSLYPFGARAFRRIRAAGLDCADHFLGFDASGAMTGARLAAELRAAPPGTVEVDMNRARWSALLDGLCYAALTILVWGVNALQRGLWQDDVQALGEAFRRSLRPIISGRCFVPTPARCGA